MLFAIVLAMSLGRPLSTLELTAEERRQLTGFASSRSLPHALVARARLVLWAAEGVSNQQIAARLSWSQATVGKWRHRFVAHRIAGIYDELRPGRPRSVSDERVAVLLRRTLKQKPPAATHWTVRQAAEADRAGSTPELDRPGAGGRRCTGSVSSRERPR